MPGNPRLNGINLLCPLVGREAKGIDAFACKQCDKAAPGHTQQFGGFATGNAVFLVKAQDDVFLDDFSGLKLIAKQCCQIARKLKVQRYPVQ